MRCLSGDSRIDCKQPDTVRNTQAQVVTKYCDKLAQAQKELNYPFFERNSPILSSRHRCMEAWCCCICNIQYWGPNLYNNSYDMLSIHVIIHIMPNNSNLIFFSCNHIIEFAILILLKISNFSTVLGIIIVIWMRGLAISTI